MKLAKVKRIDPLLLGITILAAFLNIYGIWRDQYANAYYTAAVTSMLQSFHNFFFASFDPAGFVSVDKPPVAFWVQTLFASLFGVHGWSVILPQALAGVGSVLLIHRLVKPSFGQTAARIAALTAACTPIAVAVSRTNNVDSLLVFTLLVATWMLFKGSKTRKPIWIMAAFAVVGVAFNIKMLQAYMVLPAFYLFYWLAVKVNLKRKLGILAGSTAILLVISFAWALVVDSIPQASRPYIGSSQTNSVLELAFGYNGLSRLTGQGGPGDGKSGGFGGTGYRFAQAPGQSHQPIVQGQQPGQSGSNQFSNRSTPAQGPGLGINSNGGPTPFNGQGQGGGGMFNTGTAGPFRLFQSQLSGQISWLLPFALLASIGLLAGLRRQRPLTDKQLEGLFWLAWLLPMMGFFSVAGFFHQYYLIMLAPAIAALTGAGWVELYGSYRSRDGWQRWLLPTGLVLTTLFELYVLLPYQNQIGTVWPFVLGILGIGSAIVLCLPFTERFGQAVALGGILVLMAAPLYWAATPLLDGDNAMMPAAGPQSIGARVNFPGHWQGQASGQAPTQAPGQEQGAVPTQMQGGQAPGQPQESVDQKLLAYLKANNTGEKFLFATTNAGTAEAYIIQTGKAVMAMGGFSGSDPILTVDKLKQIVAAKQVKYFLLSSGGPGGGNSQVLAWIQQHGKKVSQSLWQSTTGNSTQHKGMGMNGASTLYEVTL